ncbi:arrestin-related substrate adaptor for RhoGEF, Art1 [Schizosaccharomyces osmophilus]|uniref:Arrestin-related substrate adaptor for RhoGEF, Art1 n=1 Tax=Schizosaccharomyces osmophilus TaxID=2545709 RepID=A0AAE9WD37_9SCHI|nr:arrestin-related substrate adaptor for RhoGEF, Art1 [Schizosaccharomyces osmophilus]WBW73648.1 arrestin-related substrate adaptor for RhoGEF, Art1 [Schizosaccharomyces osmophilus]
MTAPCTYIKNFSPIEIRPLPHLDFQAGYNGIPASAPRIVGLVQVRSKEINQPLSILRVTLELWKIESVDVPSLGVSNHLSEPKRLVQQVLFPPPSPFSSKNEKTNSLYLSENIQAGDDALSPSSDISGISHIYDSYIHDQPSRRRSSNQPPIPPPHVQNVSRSTSMPSRAFSQTSDNSSMPASSVITDLQKSPEKSSSSSSSAYNIWSMDLPFEMKYSEGEVLTPTFDLVRSGFSCSTKYQLRAVLTLSGLEDISECVPIAIHRYDTLSSWGMYNSPIYLKETSIDGRVIVEASIPKQCIGPMDLLTVFISIRASNGSKIRVQQLSLSLVECVSIRHPSSNSSPIVRSKKVLKVEQDLDDVRLEKDGLSQTLSKVFPDPDLDDYSMQGFSTSSDLYKVTYMVLIKVRLYRARNVEISYPITVSPVPRSASSSILGDIQTRVLDARQSVNGSVLDTTCDIIRANDSSKNNMYSYSEDGMVLLN